MPRIAGCHYRKSDGTYESWEIRPFQLDEDSRAELKDDYENYVGLGRPNVSRDLRALRNTLYSKQSKGENQSQRNDISNGQIGGEEFDATSQASKEKHKLPKFGLSAQSRFNLPCSTLQTSSKTDPKYYEAKKRELEAHEEKGTWRIVPLPEGVKPVTSRWVNTDKYGPDGQLIKHKSRLVARGFQQEEGIDYDETFASVVKPTSTRILLALATILSWKIHQGDVKTAFLNSNLDKPVYMKPPKDIKSSTWILFDGYQSSLRIEAIASCMVPKSAKHSDQLELAHLSL